MQARHAESDLVFCSTTREIKQRRERERVMHGWGKKRGRETEKEAFLTYGG